MEIVYAKLETKHEAANPALARGVLLNFGAVVDSARLTLEAAPTSGEDIAFWLHTSGSTGKPKWAMHRHRDMNAVQFL